MFNKNCFGSQMNGSLRTAKLVKLHITEPFECASFGFSSEGLIPGNCESQMSFEMTSKCPMDT